MQREKVIWLKRFIQKVSGFVSALFVTALFGIFPIGLSVLGVRYLCRCLGADGNTTQAITIVVVAVIYLFLFYWGQDDDQARIKKKEETLEHMRSDYEAEEAALRDRAKNLETEINQKVGYEIRKYIDTITKRGYFRNSPAFSGILDSALSENGRLIRANEQMAPLKRVNIKAEIEGSKGALYETTLYRCSCPDFQRRSSPCKHMYRLALEMGVLLSVPHDQINRDFDQLINEKADLQRRAADLNYRNLVLTEKESKLNSQENELHKLIDDSSQQYPWLAKQIAEYFYLQDMKTAEYLHTKPHPAHQKADKVAEIAKQKKILQVQCKQYEYQLNFYETVFPWLEEFKQIEPKEGAKYVSEVDADYDNVRNWLSPEEYHSLPSVEKNQRALDRWRKRKRTDWEAGIDYERYVGYIFEQDKYKVNYSGATRGLEDMGRDLIAEDKNVILVIQCKRWSQEKTIHEKHIFQLYGTSVLMSLHSQKPVKAVFVTTTRLSETARECAEYLHVDVRENSPFRDFPMVKCNISRNGEKIYHLPFDQQYDRVVIELEKGEFYAWTVKEAEDAGFRRAYRWSAS